MMTRTQYLLGKLAEEAAEIAQIALKAQQFGLEETYTDKTNKERCHLEIDDLLGVVALLNKESNFNYSPSHANLLKKVDKVNVYYEYSKECGMVK